MPAATKTPAEVQSHILLKAEQDVEFRTRLIADPKGVIEAETGVVLPDEAVVLVEEAIADHQQNVSPVDAPLTPDELAQVTGGFGDGGGLGDWADR